MVTLLSFELKAFNLKISFFDVIVGIVNAIFLLVFDYIIIF